MCQQFGKQLAGPDVNGGAAGATCASICSKCPAGSYSNATGEALYHKSNIHF